MKSLSRVSPIRQACSGKIESSSLPRLLGIGVAAGLAIGMWPGFSERPSLKMPATQQWQPFTHFGASAAHWMTHENDVPRGMSGAPHYRACRPDGNQDVAWHLRKDAQLRNALASRIGKTYRIGQQNAKAIVDRVVRISATHEVDPFLILGIASIESSMNPKAKSSYGAAGLMQVYAPSHGKLLQALGAGSTDSQAVTTALMRDLDLNVSAGAQIYKRYLQQYESVPKALQAYNGARKDQTLKYSRKVLAKRNHYRNIAQARISVQTAIAGLTSEQADFMHLTHLSPASGQEGRVSTIAGFASRDEGSAS